MTNDDLIRLPHPPLENFPGIEALLKRPSRAEGFEAENHALVVLADELANHPRNLLQKLTEIALELCRAESAGISILEPDGRSFRWDACAGLLAKNLGISMLHAASPCGVVIERDSPILFEKPSSLFDLPQHIEPPIEEILLLPFHDGKKPVGTVWVVAHSPERKFDREDVRVMTSLSRFASAAYQFTRSMDKGMNARDFLEKRVDERTKALSLANRALRSQIMECERIEEALREAQHQLKAELSSLNRLHKLSSRLVNTPDLPSALKKILEAAVTLLGADMGTIQLYDPASKSLTIAAHQGFKQDFLDHFRTVDAEGDAACSRALAGQQRLVIEDIQADKRYAIHRAAADQAGYRAVQATPL
ncbi:MAG: GAF domain-containing protein, partial [Nitrosospira sp.]